MSARYALRGGGLAFRVRLTPKGGRDAIEGWGAAADGTVHLKARVRAAPEDGKANAALLELLAGMLGVAESRIAFVGGTTARLKTVAVTGDTALLAARLDGWNG